MLPRAWNVLYSAFSRLCLPGLTFKGIRLFIYIEINSCRTKNNICLVGGLQEHGDQTFVDSYKNKGFSHPLQGLACTKKSATTNHTPSPFSIKRSLNSSSGKMFLWDTGLPSSPTAAFLNKVAIPCPNTWSLDLLACHGASGISLHLVTELQFGSSKL